jgi:hypothetical protein
LWRVPKDILDFEVIRDAGKTDDLIMVPQAFARCVAMDDMSNVYDADVDEPFDEPNFLDASLELCPNIAMAPKRSKT